MRKYISIVICILIILSGITISAEDNSIPDTQSAQYYEILSGLGIISGYDEGAFNLDEPVTRAEFAMLMTMLIGMDELSSQPTTAMFYDVPVTYWASGYIKTAFETGLMNGTSQTTFEPEGHISFEQASKVIVNIMGYGNLAESVGGYPAGYVATASQYKLTDGVPGGILTRADVLTIMMNALETECLEEGGFTNESISLKKGKTLLEKYHGITKLDGQLVSTGYASIYGEALCDELFVRIDETNYNANGKNYFSLLGEMVDFYTDKDNKILYMNANGESDVITVDAKDIIKSKTGFEKDGSVKFVYYENGREKEINLSHRTGYIVNNRPYKPPFVIENVAPDYGCVKLIDGNNDGSYETVITDKYIAVVAKSVNSFDGFIADELGNNNLTDLNDTDKTIKVIKNGKEIKYSEIAGKNVLLVKLSQDSEYTEILVSEQYITGKVEAYSESDNKIIVDAVEYELHPSFDNSSLKIGSTHTLGIDAFGSVVWLDNTKTRNSGYAYLYGARLSSMKDRLEIKILGSDGKMEELSSKEHKVKFNDKITSVENVCASLCDAHGNVTEQVIAVNKTADGYIDSIKAGSEISMDYPPAKRAYSVTQKLFGMYEPNGFAVDENTAIFIIAQDSSESKVVPVSVLQDKVEYDTVEGYNGKETFVCEAVVIRPKAGLDTVPFEWSTPFGVIEDTYETLNADGDVITGFKISVKGVTVNLTATDKAFATKILMPNAVQTKIPLTELRSGDIVHYNLDLNGNIENIGRLFPYETGGNASTEADYIASHGWSRERTFGTVQKIAGDYMSLKVGEEFYTFMIRSVGVTVYDYEEEQCREGSLGDIVDYETDPDRASKVFIRANNGRIDDIIVFKN